VVKSFCGSAQRVFAISSISYTTAVDAGTLIRRSRLKAGLTQAELAKRMGTTQSAVARVERPGSNPRIATLSRALLATGGSLDLRSPRRKSGLDETLIARQLRMTPEQRLKSFEAAYNEVRKVAGAVG
jgi:transcriptional regulator with XRE-family HTH domain